MAAADNVTFCNGRGSALPNANQSAAPAGEPVRQTHAKARPAFPLEFVVTANLNSANPDGIAEWTNGRITEPIRTGNRLNGRPLVRLMALDR